MTESKHTRVVPSMHGPWYPPAVYAETVTRAGGVEVRITRDRAGRVVGWRTKPVGK